MHDRLSPPGRQLLDRRDFLGYAGRGLGAIALASLLHEQGKLRAEEGAGKAADGMPPTATAGGLVAMLASISAHQRVFEAWSIKLTELRAAMIGLVYMGITQKKPVAA